MKRSFLPVFGGQKPTIAAVAITEQALGFTLEPVLGPCLHLYLALIPRATTEAQNAYSSFSNILSHKIARR